MFLNVIQFLFFITALILGLLIYISRSLARKNLSRGILLIATASFIWLLGAVLEVYSSRFTSMLFWRNFTQIGVCFLPAAMLFFSTEFSELSLKVRRVWRIAVSLLAVIAVILLWTNEFHHLMRTSVVVSENKLGTILKVHSTPFGLIFMSYVSASHFLSEIFLIRFLTTAVPRVRRQLYLIVIGLAFPVLFIATKSFFPTPFLSNIPTPISFIPMGCFLIAAVSGFRKNALSPVALTKIFNVIDEYLIITDPEGELLDLNLRALELLERGPTFQPEDRKQPFRLETISHEWYDAVRGMPDGDSISKVRISKNNRIYEVSINPLFDARERYQGKVSLLRDITDEQKIKEDLQNKAERDGLTGCLNKSVFQEKAESSLAGAREKSASTAMIMFDMDHFKSINDSLGHGAGDLVLRTISLRIRTAIKVGDLFGRLGGEEFAVLVTGEEREIIQNIADRMKTAVTSQPVHSEDAEIPVTASFGCVYIPDGKTDYNSLYAAADKALYKAKETGRDRICW